MWGGCPPRCRARWRGRSGPRGSGRLAMTTTSGSTDRIGGSAAASTVRMGRLKGRGGWCSTGWPPSPTSGSTVHTSSTPKTCGWPIGWGSTASSPTTSWSSGSPRSNHGWPSGGPGRAGAVCCSGPRTSAGTERLYSGGCSGRPRGRWSDPGDQFDCTEPVAVCPWSTDDWWPGVTGRTGWSRSDWSSRVWLRGRRSTSGWEVTSGRLS